jgi:hypothetical protein
MVSKPNPEQSEPNSEVSEDGLSLSLEDTVAQRMRGIAKRAKGGVVGGYNPYDMEPTAPKKAEATEKPTDLRKLSEWIRLTRQVAALKKEKPD